MNITRKAMVFLQWSQVGKIPEHFFVDDEDYHESLIRTLNDRSDKSNEPIFIDRNIAIFKFSEDRYWCYGWFPEELSNEIWEEKMKWMDHE